MTAWIVGILSAAAGLIGMRMYDRIKLEGTIDDRATLRSENAQLRHRVAQLEFALHDAKRARMQHDDVGSRLRDLARDSPGRV